MLVQNDEAMRATIIGSGSYIPKVEVENDEFIDNPFFFDDGKKVQSGNEDVIEKFRAITGISSRR